MIALVKGPLGRSKSELALYAGSALVKALVAVAIILLIQQFLAGVLGTEQGLAATLKERFGQETALWSVAILLFFAYLLLNAATYTNQVTHQRIVRSLEVGVMDRLVRHLMTLSVRFFDLHSEGDLMQAIRQDIAHLRAALSAAAKVGMEAMLALGYAAAAFWISLEMAFWVLIVLPLACVPLILLARRVEKQSFAIRRRSAALMDVILQILRGIRVIKIFRGEQREAGMAVERARHYFDAMVRITRMQALSQVLLESLSGLSIVVIVVLGGFKVMSGDLAWPSLLAFLIAVRSMHGPMNNLNGSYLQILQNAASVDRLATLLDERPSVADRPNALPFDGRVDSLAFRNVAYDYEGTAALRGLSFEIKRGQTLGVVGPSGSGKSTMLSLVARLLDPESGQILLNGVDLRNYRLGDLYDNVAYVPQLPFLFDATIRDNIRCGRENATNAEIEAAARAAGIHEEIVRMPRGYDTALGGGGAGLSVGQSQRINVARAIVKRAPMLLLDEATSSLDSLAEARVQKGIESSAESDVTIVVAHRLSTLKNADLILVLEEGSFNSIGTHEELLARCALYRDMWATQQSARQPAA